MNPEKRTFLGLLAGIGLFLVVGELGCLFFLPASGPVMIGMLLGAAGSAGLAYHMYTTLFTTLSLPEKRAISYARRQSLLRMLIMMALLAVSAYFGGRITFFGTLAGLFFLKFAAYLEPLIEKLLFRKGR